MIWWRCLFVLLLVLSITAIQVPVTNPDTRDKSLEEASSSDNDADQSKTETNSSDEDKVDSYLIPPATHTETEVLVDDGDLPATYLLPPAVDRKAEFSQGGEQSDWYPIAQEPPLSVPQTGLLLPLREQPLIAAYYPQDASSSEVIQVPLRGGKLLRGGEGTGMIAIPSLQLEPPRVDAPNDYKSNIPSRDLQLPLGEINEPFTELPTGLQLPYLKEAQFQPIKTGLPSNLRFKTIDPTLALHLTPPKPAPKIFYNPTKLYPKKFHGFKRVPIPVAAFAEDTQVIPKAKPLKTFKPVTSVEGAYLSPDDEKKIYLRNLARQKLDQQKDNEANQLDKQDAEQEEQDTESSEETHVEESPSEQEALATNYRHPGRNAYPAPLRQEPPSPTPAQPAPAPGERTEFRMHGMKGPHSYQFGYDTGKGKNRQFRFEERDNDGHVKGHYGYVDRHGKLRVVNYNADQNGFHADPVQDKE